MKKTKIEAKTSKTYVAVFVWVRSSRNNDNAIRMTGETYLFDAYISWTPASTAARAIELMIFGFNPHRSRPSNSYVVPRIE